MLTTTQDFVHVGLDVLETEAQALHNLAGKINQQFANACQQLLKCQGRVIVTGMGKSGHIGKKIAATFASTGTPAQFVHPAEASHGDLGMITNQDVVIALSYSGETHELLTIVPLIKRKGVYFIALTGHPKSQLAKFSDSHIDIGIEKEACSLGLAPTASTTATLAMGDALAMAVLQARGFTANDFALSHPGGSLGKKLLVKIADIMRTGDDIPRVPANTCVMQAIVEISNKCLGMTTIVDPSNPQKILGIFTDGDLRRFLDKDLNLKTTIIGDVMTKTFKTVVDSAMASEAVSLMEKYKIFSLPVVNKQQQLVGAFNMHQLLQAGVV